METKEKTIITVETTVNAQVDQVWKLWTLPEHITQWNNASDDWHTPHAENDMRIGGGFLCRMEAKDGSFGFDFSGKYLEIKENELIVYVIEDGRKVHISFLPTGNTTSIIESFEAEGVNSLELQKNGWQSILDNFKKYAESKS
jgi:uncharacterized protein YndB with AHSA1/START domain